MLLAIDSSYILNCTMDTESICHRLSLNYSDSTYCGVHSITLLKEKSLSLPSKLRPFCRVRASYSVESIIHIQTNYIFEQGLDALELKYSFYQRVLHAIRIGVAMWSSFL